MFQAANSGGFRSLRFAGSCLLNQLLSPVNAPSNGADPGKCQQGAFYRHVTDRRCEADFAGLISNTLLTAFVIALCQAGGRPQRPTDRQTRGAVEFACPPRFLGFEPAARTPGGGPAAAPPVGIGVAMG